jgi:hypothetical protein
MRLSCSLAAALLGCFAAPVAAERQDWENMRGRPIVDVRVESSDVFDPSRTDQDHFVFEWANALHMVTRPHIIRREFVQAIGDPFDPQRAAECERNLRDRYLFQDVNVNVAPLGDGVEVLLRTVDRWSMRTYPVLRSQGGVNQIGLVVGETNLLGLGVEVGFSGIYSNDVSGVGLVWRDRRLLGSRWDVGFGLRNDDLGDGQWAAVTHPFYADDAPWSTDMRYVNEDTERRLFETGTEVARLRVHEELYEGYVGLHSGQPTLQRWALFYGRRHLTGDETNDIGAMGIAWSALHRTFDYRRDLDQMGPREELSHGFAVQLGAGMDARALGGARDRFLYRVQGSWSQSLGTDALCGVFLQHHGFLDGGPPENGRIVAETYGFWKHGGPALTWRLGGDALLAEPRSQRFNLGSDDRLRGYEARALNGTRVLYGGLEERLFSARRVLFLRLGAVAFVDAAAAWDDGEALDRSHARLGGGIGLRFGTDPAGSNVTRLDLGVGTNSVALSFSSGSFFDVSRAISFPTTLLFR